MRFGISEISWMFPKILRIRRELVFSPLVVFRGASIALVAMCFPALSRRRMGRAPALSFPALPGEFVERLPATLSNAFGPCAGSDPVPERTGKAPGARQGAARADMFG
jgi:hypothetical protein